MFQKQKILDFDWQKMTQKVEYQGSVMTLPVVTGSNVIIGTNWEGKYDQIVHGTDPETQVVELVSRGGVNTNILAMSGQLGGYVQQEAQSNNNNNDKSTTHDDEELNLGDQGESTGPQPSQTTTCIPLADKDTCPEQAVIPMRTDDMYVYWRTKDAQQYGLEVVCDKQQWAMNESIIQHYGRGTLQWFTGQTLSSQSQAREKLMWLMHENGDVGDIAGKFCIDQVVFQNEQQCPTVYDDGGDTYVAAKFGVNINQQKSKVITQDKLISNFEIKIGDFSNSFAQQLKSSDNSCGTLTFTNVRDNGYTFDLTNMSYSSVRRLYYVFYYLNTGVVNFNPFLARVGNVTSTNNAINVTNIQLNQVKYKEYMSGFGNTIQNSRSTKQEFPNILQIMGPLYQIQKVAINQPAWQLLSQYLSLVYLQSLDQSVEKTYYNLKNQLKKVCLNGADDVIIKHVCSDKSLVASGKYDNFLQHEFSVAGVVGNTLATIKQLVNTINGTGTSTYSSSLFKSITVNENDVQTMSKQAQAQLQQVQKVLKIDISDGYLYVKLILGDNSYRNVYNTLLSLTDGSIIAPLTAAMVGSGSGQFAILNSSSSANMQFLQQQFKHYLGYSVQIFSYKDNKLSVSSTRDLSQLQKTSQIIEAAMWFGQSLAYYALSKKYKYLAGWLNRNRTPFIKQSRDQMWQMQNEFGYSKLFDHIAQNTYYIAGSIDPVANVNAIFPQQYIKRIQPRPSTNKCTSKCSVGVFSQVSDMYCDQKQDTSKPTPTQDEKKVDASQYNVIVRIINKSGPIDFATVESNLKKTDNIKKQIISLLQPESYKPNTKIAGQQSAKPGMKNSLVRYSTYPTSDSEQFNKHRVFDDQLNLFGGSKIAVPSVQKQITIAGKLTNVNIYQQFIPQFLVFSDPSNTFSKEAQAELMDGLNNEDKSYATVGLNAVAAFSGGLFQKTLNNNVVNELQKEHYQSFQYTALNDHLILPLYTSILGNDREVYEVVGYPIKGTDKVDFKVRFQKMNSYSMSGLIFKWDNPVQQDLLHPTFKSMLDKLVQLLTADQDLTKNIRSALSSEYTTQQSQQFNSKINQYIKTAPNITVNDKLCRLNSVSVKYSSVNIQYNVIVSEGFRTWQQDLSYKLSHKNAERNLSAHALGIGAHLSLVTTFTPVLEGQIATITYTDDKLQNITVNVRLFGNALVTHNSFITAGFKPNEQLSNLEQVIANNNTSYAQAFSVSNVFATSAKVASVLGTACNMVNKKYSIDGQKIYCSSNGGSFVEQHHVQIGKDFDEMVKWYKSQYKK